MHLFYQPEIQLGYLPAEESHHAVKVLRLATGDEFDITDGKGSLYKARVKGPNAKHCEFEIINISTTPKRKFSIHLAVAPTKNADRMEWMVEKCVEVGVEKISFLLCKTSERKSVNIERLMKTAISALKQSQQNWLPTLNQMISFAKFLDARTETQKFIARVDESNPRHLKHLASPGTDYVIMVGPEGDYTKEELENAISKGFQKVSLGPTRLRTETAGLFAVTAFNILNQG